MENFPLYRKFFTCCKYSNSSDWIGKISTFSNRFEKVGKVENFPICRIIFLNFKFFNPSNLGRKFSDFSKLENFPPIFGLKLSTFLTPSEWNFGIFVKVCKSENRKMKGEKEKRKEKREKKRKRKFGFSKKIFSRFFYF